MVKLILLGPPNSGKGTYGERMIKKHNLIKISSGDLFRENIKNNTKLGEEAKKYLNSGLLVPDELTINMMENRIRDMQDFVLDGFPRTLKQATALDSITRIDKVLNFTASESTLLDRALGRLICPKCNTTYHIRNIPPKISGICDKDNEKLIQREDSNIERAKERLKIYEKETLPLIDFFKKKNLLISFDTEKSMNEVLKEIEDVIF